MIKKSILIVMIIILLFMTACISDTSSGRQSNFQGKDPLRILSPYDHDEDSIKLINEIFKELEIIYYECIE